MIGFIIMAGWEKAINRRLDSACAIKGNTSFSFLRGGAGISDRMGADSGCV